MLSLGKGLISGVCSHLERAQREGVVSFRVLLALGELLVPLIYIIYHISYIIYCILYIVYCILYIVYCMYKYKVLFLPGKSWGSLLFVLFMHEGSVKFCFRVGSAGLLDFFFSVFT